MKVKSAMVQQASGSLGGATWSHNAGGMYIRSRTTPTDPGSLYQTAIRTAVANLVNLWVNVLTAGQRAAWNTYAANVPLDDVFGDPRFRSGINHYVRSNVPRLQIGAPRVDDGPIVFNLGEFSLPWFTASEATQELTCNFGANDEWVDEDGSYMILYGSRPQNPSIDFFKGPYRKYGYIGGSVGDPPGSPQAAAAPFAFVESHRLFLRVNVSRDDGRLGTSVRTFCSADA